MAVITAMVFAMEVYAAVGLVFAVPFVSRWVQRIDPVAADGTWGFRLLILPGAAALWPWLMLRLLRARGAEAAR